MPSACPNEVKTAGIEQHQDDEKTGSHQENSRLTHCVKRPPKQQVARSKP